MFKVKQLSNCAQLPHKAFVGDAGFDVFGTINRIIGPQSWGKIPLGFSLELPSGWVALIQGRSGLASKQGIFTIGNVIDSGYRGECHAILYNGGHDTFEVKRGDKIAQMLVISCYTKTVYEVVDNLTYTPRGADGFGSTGLGNMK